MSLEVRRPRPSEYAAAGDVVVAAYDAAGVLIPDDPYVAWLRDVARRDREDEVWVAADGADLLGVVTFCPVGAADREIGRDDEGEFRALAVDPSRHRTGAGTALVQRCLDRSRELGYAGMALSTLVEFAAAQALYRRFGFERAPERDWSPHEGVDLIAYTLRF